MIVWGKNVLKEAVLNKHEIYNLMIDVKFSDNKFLEFLNNHNIRYNKYPKDKLNEVSKNAIHQGIVADIRPYKIYDLLEVLKDDEVQKFIILDQITDPQNLGSILRSANATGFSGVIISKKEQVGLTGVVAKASSGAIEYEKVIIVSNLNNAILKLKEKGFLILGSSDKASISYKEIPKNKKLCIILGSEGVGMRYLISKNCDLLVKIPMLGKISSLNVGVAGALLMYETIK